MGIEPTLPALEGWSSTIELHPHINPQKRYISEYNPITFAGLTP